MSENQRVTLCLSCGNKTPHTVYSEQEEEQWNSEGTELLNTHFFIFLRCGTCNQLAVHIEWGDETQSLWPKNHFLGPAVPQSVQTRYRDALLVKSRLPSAFAVQIRRALEAICKEQGVQGRTLSENLSQLVTNLSLPAIASDMARVSRLLGNKGAHDGPDVTEKEASTLEEFFLALIEYVYVAPAKLATYQAALAKLQL